MFQSRAFDNTVSLVTLFYAINLYFAVDRLRSAPMWLDWSGEQVLSPLWCVYWLHLVDIPTGAIAILLGNVVAALAAAIWPNVTLFRVASALGLLQMGALDNSFGKISHGNHLWLWVLIGLIFLPPNFNGTSVSRWVRQRTLDVFWGIQAVLLMFYSMSGLLKLLPVPFQFWAGQPTAFSPDALARHIADRALQTGSSSLFGDLFVENIWLSWPAFICGLFLETFSLAVAFRPRVHRLWGVALIGLHLSIGLTMGIWFIKNILLIGLFFLNSPFTPRRANR